MVEAGEHSLRAKFVCSEAAREELPDFVGQPSDKGDEQRKQHTCAYESQSKMVEHTFPMYAPEARFSEIAFRQDDGKSDERNDNITDADRHCSSEATECQRISHQQRAEQTDAKAGQEIHEQSGQRDVLRLAEAVEQLIYEASECSRDHHQQVLPSELSDLRTRRNPMQNVF